MKLATFKVHTEERLGTYIDNQIVDLTSAYALYLKEVEKNESALRWASAVVPPSMTGFLEGGEESLKAAKKTLDYVRDKKSVVGLDGEKIFLNMDDVRIISPVPRPGKVYCLAVNYFDHATENLSKEPEKRKAEIDRLKSLNLSVPAIFLKPPALIVSPDAPIIKPRNSNQVDYECELAVIIGKRGKYISQDKAYDYIGGYTIMNDVSFRDQGFPTDVAWNFYKIDMNWTKSKGMDNAAPMGPCLVTKDEIPDPYSPPLRLVTRVNGQTRQNNDVSWMIIKIPRLIEYLSNGTTLEPGDVISTGTVAGVARSWPDGYLKVGDVVENEIQPIGVQKHKVVAD